MSKRAVQPTKRITDRRRSGAGDNSAFTVHMGAGGLAAGQRVSNLVAPSMTLHQYTNRAHRTAMGTSNANGRGKRTI